MYLILPAALGPGVRSASNRNSFCAIFVCTYKSTRWRNTNTVERQGKRIQRLPQLSLRFRRPLSLRVHNAITSAPQKRKWKEKWGTTERGGDIRFKNCNIPKIWFLFKVTKRRLEVKWMALLRTPLVSFPFSIPPFSNRMPHHFFLIAKREISDPHE
jgi:hypothetical protein